MRIRIYRHSTDRIYFGTIFFILFPIGLLTHCSTVPQVETLSNGFFSSKKQTDARCRTSGQKTVTTNDSTINISYVEPHTRTDGSALNDLKKTTIYYDLGSGLVKVKDIPATSPQGGGKITDTIKVQVGAQETITTMVCVTATDGDGREG